jgi:preprotein translocase subunit YajC
MTSFPPVDSAVVIAMAAAPNSSVNPLVQFIPFVLVLAIFYFVILLPMKRRQKKVEAFLAALKVGDKVVTTGGLHGSVAKLDADTVHLQIAQNVRVEISRSAVVGYQGQPPVTSEGS